ncbi:nuclear transport factor 2 family protein [Nonomuraea sp. NPDC050556]|uniref:nuclear transport factor 2 family protein n=1 Tax=Nonomuraea sp. NPDC050556 TaxID=3364369 RepID=UPI0037A03999
MYHRIVKGKVRQIFAAISAGNWEPMVAGLAPRFRYTFYGNHALSGERHTHEAMRRWWERTARLLPGTRFDVKDIVVRGWPWSTTVAARVDVRVTLADGSNYNNTFMQFVHMKWARIDEVHTLEDTAVLQDALDRLYAAGYEEAHATPITDREPALR